jgi:hypothetical protein
MGKCKHLYVRRVKVGGAVLYLCATCPAIFYGGK